MDEYIGFCFHRRSYLLGSPVNRALVKISLELWERFLPPIPWHPCSLFRMRSERVFFMRIFFPFSVPVFSYLYLFIYLFIYDIYLFIHLFFYSVFVCLFVYLFIYLLIHLFIYLFFINWEFRIGALKSQNQGNIVRNKGHHQPALEISREILKAAESSGRKYGPGNRWYKPCCTNRYARAADYYTYTAGSGASCVDARLLFPLSRCDLCMSHPISVTPRQLLLQYVHILPPPSPVRPSPCSGTNFL